MGGLNSSLRSVKLDKNLVIGVSMGSSRTMDEFGVILFSNFFHDAAKNPTKHCYDFNIILISILIFLVNLYNVERT